MFDLNGVVVANTISLKCFWLARESDFNTKATKLIADTDWVIMGSSEESESTSLSHTFSSRE